MVKRYVTPLWEVTSHRTGSRLVADQEVCADAAAAGARLGAVYGDVPGRAAAGHVAAFHKTGPQVVRLLYR